MKLKHLFENEMPKIIDPVEAYLYAKQQRRRIPELEPFIMKNPKWACRYARDIIKDRWPEAEPIIMKQPEIAFYYASYVIKGRWPEAEPYIMKNMECADWYLGDFPEARSPSKDEPLMLCKFEITDVPNTITDEQTVQLLKIIEPNIIAYDVLKHVKSMRTYYRPEFKHSFANRIQQITTKQLIKDDKLRHAFIAQIFGSSNFKSDFE